MMILSIETSCDDSCVALIDTKSGDIVANLISSQIDIHKKYGGVVPELAGRGHLNRLPLLVRDCLEEFQIKKETIDFIAVTKQPGLIGSLLIGVNFAKAMAWSLDIPVIGIDHLEGHINSCFIENNKLQFPFVTLVVSGGHTHFFLAEALGQYQLLGKTIDDAAGEAYDKVAKLLGFHYPGGKIIDQLAQNYSGDYFELPFPLEHKNNFDLSFSGLKTAVLRIAEQYDLVDETTQLISLDAFLKTENTQKKNDKIKLAASFQKRVEQIFEKRFSAVLEKTRVKQFTICGGVAANQGIRTILAKLAKNKAVEFYYPSIPLCTDNAAMIGYTAWLYGKPKPKLAFDYQLSPISKSHLF